MRSLVAFVAPSPFPGADSYRADVGSCYPGFGTDPSVPIVVDALSGCAPAGDAVLLAAQPPTTPEPLA